MPSLARRLILCCDGTNDNLTGRSRDTNVVKFCELLAATPDPQRLVFYDPGVGHAEEVPATDLIEKFRQSLDRSLALAFGRGIYDNVAEGYRFLMRQHQPGDQIYLFGFSRGAFTARSIGGMVNQFGLLAPHQGAMVPTLVALYFADRHPGRGARARFGDTAGQAARLFTPADRREVPLHFTGVWDTVASVGTWPSKARFTAKPDLGETKHFVHVRQALSLDELRAQFAPRLYLGPNGPFKTKDGLSGSLVQLWFSGDHSDVGGGHEREESALSDEAAAWLLSEAVGCGLPLSHLGQPLRTEAQVLQALRDLGLSEAHAPNAVHRQVRLRRLWALTGLAPRDTRHVVWDGGSQAHHPVEHPSVAQRAATLREAPVPAQPWAQALAWTGLVLAYLCSGELLRGGESQGSLWLDLLATLQHLGDIHRANLDFSAWQLGAWRDGALEPAQLAPFKAPRAALLADLALIASYAYLIAGPVAWACIRLAGRRRAGDGRASWLLRALGWALPAAVGADLLENLSGVLAISLRGDPVFSWLPQGLAQVMAAACAFKWLALAACGLLVAWALLRPAPRRAAPPLQ